MTCQWGWGFMLATFSSIQSRSTNTVGQIMENILDYKNWTVRYHVYKCTVQSAEIGGQVENQVHNPVSK